MAEELKDMKELREKLMRIPRSRQPTRSWRLAERMRTSQSFIVRLESGRAVPNLKTLKRGGETTGTRVKVALVAA